MNNYNSPEYDYHRTIIREIQKKNGWEAAKYFNCNNENELDDKLKNLITIGAYPENFTSKLWLYLWNELKETEEKSNRLEERLAKSTLVAANADNNMTVPEREETSWQLYKRGLIESNWSQQSVTELEETTLSILRKLNINTSLSEPTKGLVIGNVQSGKTANMAGLISMAADWGWNLFIVLSGTIENLRKQTEDRLMKDLDKTGGNLAWVRILKPSRHSDSAERTYSLLLGDKDYKRYLTVCLKNSTRLNNLLSWLTEDENKLKQMKILVIDDEADQGGINTKDISKEERSKINELIVKLGNLSGKSKSKPQSLNYVSYTATPYANFLNEATLESLYPKDFIAVLNPAKEYFGPKEIFGLEESEENRGMKIVRHIEDSKEADIDEIKQINMVHKGLTRTLPKSLKDSIHWFFCATAVMRYRKYKSPISMLIHTSQSQSHHSNLALAVQAYINSYDDMEWIEKCKIVYEFEKNEMLLEDFQIDCPHYPYEVKDYPMFSKIESEIKRLKGQLSHIELGEEGVLKYHEGIHLCIDNCSQNGTQDDMYVRLAYPNVPQNHKDYPKPAPAFIVIGGSTLSRGLTLEGLVSSYFLRTTKLADSLMQMGRWFGYRRNYEMLPRIWMTRDTNEKFKFLATLDNELREELKIYSLQSDSPNLYGPRIKNSPKIAWLQITSKNKSQSAVETDIDFSGTNSQTVLFNNDLIEQQHNLEITENFLEDLGGGEKSHLGNSVVWRSVEFQKIKKYLLDFRFNQNSRVFQQIENLCEWYESQCLEIGFDDWNVVIAGRGKVDDEKKENVWKVSNYYIGKITRSKKKGSYTPNILEIGVLRAPSDLYADIEPKQLEMLTDDYKDFSKANAGYVYEVRKKANLMNTPQLLIYRIDKNSKAEVSKNERDTNRVDLEASEDLIGISVYIPGYSRKGKFASKLTIELPEHFRTQFVDSEVEDSNED